MPFWSLQNNILQYVNNVLYVKHRKPAHFIHKNILFSNSYVYLNYLDTCWFLNSREESKWAKYRRGENYTLLYFHAVKIPRGEISSGRNLRLVKFSTAKFLRGKISAWQEFRAVKFPRGNNSEYRNFCAAKLLAAKLLVTEQRYVSNVNDFSRGLHGSRSTGALMIS